VTFLRKILEFLESPNVFPFAGPLVMIALMLAGLKTGAFERFEDVAYDARLRHNATHHQPTDPRLIFIGVTDVSMEAFGAWPWDRARHIELLKKLQPYQPAAVLYDILFVDPKDAATDDELGQAAADVGAFIAAAHLEKPGAPNLAGFNRTEFGATTPLRVTGPAPGVAYSSPTATLPFANLAFMTKLGFVDSEPDPDGIRRKIPLVVAVKGEIYPTMTTQALMQIWGLEGEQVEVRFGRDILFHRPEGAVAVPIDINGEMWVNWRPLHSFRQNGFAELIALLSISPVEPGWEKALKNSIIVVGQSSTGLTDVAATPLEPVVPMPTIHLNALNTIFTQSYIHVVPNWMVLIGWTVLAVLSALHLRDRPIGWVLTLPLVMVVGYILICYTLAQSKQLMFPMVWPTFFFGLLHVGTLGILWRREQKQKLELKGIFSSYVSKLLLDHILRYPDSLRLGGVIRPVSIFFSDIRSFTTISESRSPSGLVDMLNDYFGEMVACVHRHKGTLHKYIGDAIMAVWGDILDQSDEVSAQNSVRAALEMRERLAAFNERQRAAGDLELSIGMGINFGEVLVGHIGAPERREFTVIGDAVNTASRLEGLTKTFKTDLVVGPRVHENLGDTFIRRCLGLIVVQGRSEPVRVYEILAESNDPELRAWAASFDRAMDLYVNRDFAAAEEAYAHCQQTRPDDFACGVYRKSCQEFQIAPPDDDWKGVFVMKSK